MKKTSKALMVGASLLALAGVANAATYELNMTGASAQFNYWNDVAHNWLESTATGAPGCAVGSTVQAVTVDGKKGYAKCTNGAGDIYIVRYSANASYDGITALQGTQDPSDPTDGLKCNGGSGTILRKYADDTVAPGSGGAGAGKIPNTAILCKPSNVGFSDVNAASFSQSSKGLKLGPLGKNTDAGYATPKDYMCGPESTRSQAGTTFVPIDANPSSPFVLTNSVDHLAVPFAFFVNKGVTWKKCGTAGSTVAQRNNNNFCQVNADCNTAGGETCQPTTIDNLTRLQAILLFSGTVTNWGQFGNYFDAKPVIACLRHAGSGTAATLDHAVMKGTWGKPLVTMQKNNLVSNHQNYDNAGLISGTSTSLNYIWFNNGAGDVKNCLDGKIYDDVKGATQAARSDLGIVGYMDADQPDAGNYVQVKYQGVKASRQAVRNGWYDYYTMQNIYYNPSDSVNTPTAVQTLIQNLISFAANPANIIDAVGISGVNEFNYWATKGELRFTKGSDTTYPVTKSAVANVIPGAQTP